MTINEQSDDDSMRDIDVCSNSFAELRKEDMLYIDKSLLIKDMLEANRRGVYLYTRPRRFGKSTNLTMLNSFFNVKFKGNTWFDDLEISKFSQFEPDFDTSPYARARVHARAREPKPVLRFRSRMVKRAVLH